MDYYKQISKDYDAYRSVKMTETGNMASIIGAQKAIISILSDTLRECGAKKHMGSIASRLEFADKTAKECEYVFENRQKAEYNELINEIRATLEK